MSDALQRLRVFLLATAAAAALYITWAGPIAEPAPEAPVAAWMREHEALQENAEPFYLRALEMMNADAPTDWEKRGLDSPAAPPEDIAAWVDSHGDALALIRRGAECDQCRLKASGRGFIEVDAKLLRTLTRFVLIRGRIAEVRRDLDEFADCMLLADALARHALEQHTLIMRLIGTACLALIHEQEVLRPFAWQPIEFAALRRYSQRIAPLDRPIPLFDHAIESDRAMSCWMYREHKIGVSNVALLIPERRYCGEVWRYFEPMIELSIQPVERRLDESNPLRIRITAMLGESISSLNPSRALARITVPDITRVCELDGRLIAMHRGNRTVLAIFEHAGPERTLPDSLDFLGNAEFTIDPFTGKRFLYRRTAEAFTLYSAGIDRDDDGGKHSSRFGEQLRHGAKDKPPPDGDFVFWPRQTP